MKITNTSRASQGVWTIDGLRFVEPGQTRDLAVAKDYIGRVRALPFLSTEEGAADPAKVQPDKTPLTPAATVIVEIPEDWRAQHHAKIIALAQRLGSDASTKADAIAAVEAELARRATPAVEAPAEDPWTDDELRAAVIEQLGEEGAADLDLDRTAMLALLAS